MGQLGIQLKTPFPEQKEQKPVKIESKHIPPYKLLKNFSKEERERILRNSREDREERNSMYRWNR